MIQCLGFSIYSIKSPAVMDVLTSFFPVLMPFISFSFLIALLTLLILHWVGVVKEDTLVLFMISGKCFKISFLIMGGFCCIYFYNFEVRPSSTNFMSFFIMKGCWILSAFSESIESITCFLFFILSMWLMTFIDFCMWSHPDTSQINPTWSWYMIFYM